MTDTGITMFQVYAAVIAGNATFFAFATLYKHMLATEVKRWDRVRVYIAIAVSFGLPVLAVYADHFDL